MKQLKTNLVYNIECFFYTGDYFAVRVTEDPVYATPIFTTMGGQSKCPGETMTSRRESNVRIMTIEHRCGNFADEECDYRTLGEDGEAHFAAIIFNDSPTNEAVDYSIGLASSFSKYGTSCGEPGKISGLVVEFDQTELGGIPYRQQIEVPFKVSRDSIYHCHNFVDVEISITASCEAASSSSHVYQYGLEAGKDGLKVISYDPANVMHESTSSATFSVSWAVTQRPSRAPTPSLNVRRLSANAEQEDSTSKLAAQVDELTKKVDLMMNLLVEKATAK